mgnify:CR=1 FL=1
MQIRDPDQHLVAGLVAMRCRCRPLKWSASIINSASGVLLPRGAPPLAIDLGIELAPVLQAGERVGGRHLLELVLGLARGGRSRAARNSVVARSTNRISATPSLPIRVALRVCQRLRMLRPAAFRPRTTQRPVAVAPRRTAAGYRIHRGHCRQTIRWFLTIPGSRLGRSAEILADHVEVERRPHDDACRRGAAP